MRWDGSICPLGLKQGCFKTITYRHQGGIVWIGHVFECVQLVQVWPNDYIHTPLKAHEQDRLQRRKYPLEGRHTFDVALGANKLRWCRMQWAWSCIALNKASWQYILGSCLLCCESLCGYRSTAWLTDFSTHTSGSSVKLSRAWVFSSLSAQVVEK